MKKLNRFDHDFMIGAYAAAFDFPFFFFFFFFLNLEHNVNDSMLLAILFISFESWKYYSVTLNDEHK